MPPWRFHSRCSKSSSSMCSLSCLSCELKIRRNLSVEDEESESEQPDNTSPAAKRVRIETRQDLGPNHLFLPVTVHLPHKSCCRHFKGISIHKSDVIHSLRSLVFENLQEFFFSIPLGMLKNDAAKFIQYPSHVRSGRKTRQFHDPIAVNGQIRDMDGGRG